MCDYERMVDAIREEQENQQSKEEIQELYNAKIFERLQQDLSEICNNPYLEDLKLPDDTKDTFHANFSKLLDEAREAYVEEMIGSNESIKLVTTYEIVEYIKKYIEGRI